MHEVCINRRPNSRKLTVIIYQWLVRLEDRRVASGNCSQSVSQSIAEQIIAPVTDFP